LLGYATAYESQKLDLRALVGRHPGSKDFRVAPVVLRDVDVDVDRTVQCVETGMHMIDAHPIRLAAHVHLPGLREDTLELEVVAPSREGATVILVTGEQLAQVKQCCQMARLLAPSLVIIEDVDLIAIDRDDRRGAPQQVALHQLLNEMDGLGDDARVLFLLTT